MQGYIVNINKVKDEDLIVTILAGTHIYTSYRFYGVRHSIINIGYKIDFELETSIKCDIPRLKDVIQLAYPWINDKSKLYDWQQYIKLFYYHLKDVGSIDNFYINSLDETAHKITKQNVKRAIIQNYANLCKHEGRLHQDYKCLLCDQQIKYDISLVRGLLLTHSQCNFGYKFDINKIKELFEQQSLINFNTKEIEYIWQIILQGL